jgi:hypothetical protein
LYRALASAITTLVEPSVSLRVRIFKATMELDIAVTRRATRVYHRAAESVDGHLRRDTWIPD